MQRLLLSPLDGRLLPALSSVCWEDGGGAGGDWPHLDATPCFSCHRALLALRDLHRAPLCPLLITAAGGMGSVTHVSVLLPDAELTLNLQWTRHSNPEHPDPIRPSLSPRGQKPGSALPPPQLLAAPWALRSVVSHLLICINNCGAANVRCSGLLGCHRFQMTFTFSSHLLAFLFH